MPRLAALSLVALTLSTACSVDRSGLGRPDGSVDFGMLDATTDARDAGSDAPDVGPVDAGDAGLDAGLDLAMIDLGDTGLDLGLDLGVDFGTDLGPPDLGMDAGPCSPCASPMLCCGTTCVDPRSDAMHCGGCSACLGGANAMPTCASSTCGLACNSGFDDCDGVLATGCEANLMTTATCGSCALGCVAAAHQTAMCVAPGTCTAACDTGFADCDASTLGCETDTTSSAAHCGSCATACSVGRSCASSACSTGWLATSAVGAPSARTDHCAVWTGTRMLVWGGDGITGSLNTGASYDPATDSWSTITTTGAPSARRGQTCVWTGTEMIVWGGYSSAAAAFLQDGAAYNPATNAWRTLSTTTRPSTRSRVPGVWSGTEMLIWGGFGTGGGDRQDGARYNSAANTWAMITNTARPPARRWNAAVWTGSRMVVWGGETGAGAALADGALYDPAGDSWPALTGGGAPSARARAAFVFASGLATPLMLVWGGDDGDPGGIFGNGVRTSGGRYDPAANTWSAMSASPLAGRSRATAVWTGSKMMIWGGRGANTGLGFTVVLGDGASYDPVTDGWTMLSGIAAPTARTNHTAVWTGTEMIVWGGDDGVTSQASGGRFAP